LSDNVTKSDAGGQIDRDFSLVLRGQRETKTMWASKLMTSSQEHHKGGKQPQHRPWRRLNPSSTGTTTATRQHHILIPRVAHIAHTVIVAVFLIDIGNSGAIVILGGNAISIYNVNNDFGAGGGLARAGVTGLDGTKLVAAITANDIAVVVTFTAVHIAIAAGQLTDTGLPSQT
jgi:hypothetical protein